MCHVLSQRKHIHYNLYVCTYLNIFDQIYLFLLNRNSITPTKHYIRERLLRELLKMCFPKENLYMHSRNLI